VTCVRIELPRFNSPKGSPTTGWSFVLTLRQEKANMETSNGWNPAATAITMNWKLCTY